MNLDAIGDLGATALYETFEYAGIIPWVADIFSDTGNANYTLDNGNSLNFEDMLLYQIILQRIDRGIIPKSGEVIVDSFSNIPDMGVESLIRSLEKLFLGVQNTTPIGDSNEYFNRSISVYTKIGNMIEANGGDRKSDSLGRVIPLSHLSADYYVTIAKQQGIAGDAIRYALLELNTFTVEIDLPIYQTLKTDGILNYSDQSEQYWTDRAFFLELKIKLGINDSTEDFSDPNKHANPVNFQDLSTGYEIQNYIGNGFEDVIYDRYIFGTEFDETIVGDFRRNDSDGNIVYLSNDAIADENKSLIYAARISMDKKDINVNEKTVHLSSGITVAVEMKTGKRKSPLIVRY